MTVHEVGINVMHITMVNGTVGNILCMVGEYLTLHELHFWILDHVTQINIFSFRAFSKLVEPM